MGDALGFVGLGDMGSQMVLHLLDDGFDVAVCDLDESAVESAVAYGAVPAATPREVAERSVHVGVCVPADDHVVAVVDGADGLLAGASPGSSIAVHATVRPPTAIDLAALAAERGVLLFDAGVAGGSKARDGELAITVGVPRGGLPLPARRALASSGGLVVECGPVGTGLATKVAANVMTYLQFAAISAGFDIARSSGASTESVTEVLRHNGMLGALTEQFSAVPLMTTEDKNAAGFADYLWATIGLAEKDLAIAAELSNDVLGPRPILETVRDAMWRVYGMGAPRPD